MVRRIAQCDADLGWLSEATKASGPSGCNRRLIGLDGEATAIG